MDLKDHKTSHKKTNVYKGGLVSKEIVVLRRWGIEPGNLVVSTELKGDRRFAPTKG